MVYDSYENCSEPKTFQRKTIYLTYPQAKESDVFFIASIPAEFNSNLILSFEFMHPRVNLNILTTTIHFMLNEELRWHSLVHQPTPTLNTARQELHWKPNPFCCFTEWLTDWLDCKHWMYIFFSEKITWEFSAISYLCIVYALVRSRF